MSNVKTSAKILAYDVELSPSLGYVWGKYEQNVLAYTQEWYLLCFSYKWLGEKNIKVVAQPDFPEYEKDKTNDYRVTEKLHSLFDEADVVVAHNGDNFDQKKAHARMLYHGFTPPSPYRSIDTKKVAKKYFQFNSNKLDDLGEHLGLGRKVDTGGFELWLGCMQGDEKSWRMMKSYNRQDTRLLESVYYKLRPWIDNHPSLALMDGRPSACPKCGSGPLQSRGTIKYAKVTYARRYQCQECGGWSQERLNTKSNVGVTN